MTPTRTMLSPPALRILDANANRAREALRVMEDDARFRLNDPALSGSLKALRHELRTAIGGLLDIAILHRDTPGDVGTAISTPAESRREGLADVVVAAGKRLGEALRVIEEVLKAHDPAAAAAVEGCRYRGYALEQTLARTLGRDGRLAGVRLYVLLTESLCRLPWLQTAEQAILGGAGCLQLREKDLDDGELLRRSRLLADLCRRHGVRSIVNDRPDIAILAGADGVHVGQGDLPAAEVRKIVGPGMIVGVSTHQLEQARQAVLDGADYLGAGPVFVSATKPRDILPGLDYARQIAQANLPVPSFAIAGITGDNVGEVGATGIHGIAVTADVCSAEDPRAASRRLLDALGPQAQG